MELPFAERSSNDDLSMENLREFTKKIREEQEKKMREDLDKKMAEIQLGKSKDDS